MAYNYHVMTANGEDVVCGTHAMELTKYPDFVACDTDWCDRCYVCEGNKPGTADASQV